MSIVLSKRLQAIASYIPSKMHVADIGGDHAFLLLYLAEQGVLRKGIFGDLHLGPFQSASKRISQMGYEHQIEVRRGNGLEVIKRSETDVIVIAGMGGMLIRNILNEGKEKLFGVKRLILQPNNRVWKVREWLVLNKFSLIDEDIVYEKGKLYEILVAEPGEELKYHEGELPYPDFLHIGRILWEKKHPLLKGKLEDELEKKKKILSQLSNSSNEEKRKHIEKQIKIWKEVIQCLSKEQI